MPKPVNPDMENVRAYAVRMIDAMPSPRTDEAGMFFPALAIAVVSMIGPLADKDMGKMHTLMRAFHDLLTSVHEDIIRTWHADEQARRAAEGGSDGADA